MALVHRVGWDPQLAKRSAWLWPLAEAARQLQDCSDFPTLARLDAMYAALAHARGAQALSFRIDPRPRAPALTERYDARIALRGEVPTRERNWHDLLNALCFATFPASKLALHTRQWQALERAGGAKSARTTEQDALTLFDEGGVAVAVAQAAEPELRAALVAADAATLATAQAEGSARVVPFGHALFEHLVEGVACPGGSARLLAFAELPASDAALLAAVDRALAAEIARPDRFLETREAAHLRLQAVDQHGVALRSGAGKSYPR
jgi:hypothetical protein